MCKRHSFILTRAGKVHFGHGISDHHTVIREIAGMTAENDSVNSYEWQPPKGWPNADWLDGLTKDTEVFEPKKRHLSAMESHVRRTYPDMDSWNTPDAPRLFKAGLSVGGRLYLRGSSITTLPEGLSVGGSLYLDCGSFSTVKKARDALKKAAK
jgi:hypothetical protein